MDIEAWFSSVLADLEDNYFDVVHALKYKEAIIDEDILNAVDKAVDTLGDVMDKIYEKTLREQGEEQVDRLIGTLHYAHIDKRNQEKR